MCGAVPQGKSGKLDQRFNKTLKDNWGLETLVSVGESWLPAMLEQVSATLAGMTPVHAQCTQQQTTQ